MMRKALSIFFAVLLLISNLGLTLSTHYCGGIAVNTQLVMANFDLNCGMEIKQLSCNTTAQDVVHASACCDNEHLRIQLDDEYQPQLQTVDLESVDLLSFIPHLIHWDYESTSEPHTPTRFYTPPPLIQNLPVLHQSFLI